MRDWDAASGKGSKDWDATFRNFLRREDYGGGQRAGPGRGGGGGGYKNGRELTGLDALLHQLEEEKRR